MASPKIVVVGGGIGGVTAAQPLEGFADVTLIDRSTIRCFEATFNAKAIRKIDGACIHKHSTLLFGLRHPVLQAGLLRNSLV